MALLTFDLPVTAANGPGTTVDVSTMGALKTVVMQGGGEPLYPVYVMIEVSNEAVPTNWKQVYQFTQPGSFDLTIACRFMRGVVQNYRRGSAPSLSVAANDTGCDFETLVAPAGNGNGAGVDVSALPSLKSFQVSGTFKGAVSIEVSNDGGSTYSLADGLSFTSGGGLITLPLNAQFMRVNRSGIQPNASNVGTPVIVIGASELTGGGSATITVERLTGDGTSPIVIDPDIMVTFIEGQDEPQQDFTLGNGSIDGFLKTITVMTNQTGGIVIEIQNLQQPDSFSFWSANGDGVTLQVIWNETESRWAMVQATGWVGS